MVLLWAYVHLKELDHFLGYHDTYEFGKYNSLTNIRLIHIAVHTNNPQIFLDEKNITPVTCSVLLNDLLNAFYQYDLDSEWIKTRHPVIQLFLLCIKLSGFHSTLSVFPPDMNQWTDIIKQDNCIAMAITHKLERHSFFMSQLSQLTLSFNLPASLEKSLSNLSDQYYYWHEAKGALAFFGGDNVGAVQSYEKAIKLFKGLSDKNDWFRGNLHGIFYTLSLLHKHSSSGELKKAFAAIVSLRKVTMHEALISVLESLICLKCNDRTDAIDDYNSAQYSCSRSKTIFPFLQALIDWATTLLAPEKLPQALSQYQEKFRFYYELSHHFVAQLYAELIQLQTNKDTVVQHFLEELRPLGSFRFMDILHVKQPWEYAIDQLQLLVTDQRPLAQQHASLFDKRMVWMLDPASQLIEVVEQSLGKKGEWSAGRPISLKRLYNKDSKLDYLTPQDLLCIRGLEYSPGSWYDREEFSWNRRKTLLALIEHPSVFHQKNRDIPLELVRGTVELQVEKEEQGYHFLLSHFSERACVFLEKETPNRYRVIDFSDENVAIAKILSEKGMKVPFQAKDKVIDIICNAKSSVHIQSDVADDDLPTVQGDTTPRVHLFPLQEGIKVNLWIRPFGEQGPYCRASQGQRSIMTTVFTPVGEERKKVIRNFEEEQSKIDVLIHQCSTLSEFDEKTDEWQFEDVENSLEVLLELEEYQKQAPLIIEWPKGQAIRVKKTLSSKNLSLSIKGSQYWFEYEGEVNIDENQALELKKLLELVGESQGRFIPLANGEFLALTDKFKKQLEDLRALSDGNKVYHLSTAGLRSLAKEAGTLQEDKTWKAHLKKLTAMEKHQPVIPSTLQAELRDYQREGFEYLSRLAHWEIGACLADDMGLGKTIQAISLLLTHAPTGPCLVVAPTSVCFVWLDELAKFAPTLVPHTLYNSNDREALIQRLGKMDILICSYGLLHQAGDLLIKKSWKMVILDEAQAIKNPETKRWKYATQLNSPCRLALTGTPIENHLGELWSIFRFLNPGLLGSLTHFQERFSGPIEKQQDPVARRALKNVVSPYILRRTKSEVLQELPPKIEQSILIEPSTEEMAFYEAVRAKALEKIHQLNQSENTTKRFSILAEISRLRQACCHASLVDENITIESSKIKEFLTLVKNIIDNKHKVLVFSQFVRYLTKIKDVLDHEKIDYQYLDGATSMKDRKSAVDAFQSGIGDLFLISLKAGGSGLNLTAADYVIILDPWWNPAVEEQAADRAHRMGQLRPVTVYRLIMKNSIEEKILALHKNKKDLAADLLSGSDMSGKISEEELVGLITG